MPLTCFVCFYVSHILRQNNDGKKDEERERKEERNSSDLNDIAIYVFSAIASVNPHETILDYRKWYEWYSNFTVPFNLNG